MTPRRSTWLDVSLELLRLLEVALTPPRLKAPRAASASSPRRKVRTARSKRAPRLEAGGVTYVEARPVPAAEELNDGPGT